MAWKSYIKKQSAWSSSFSFPLVTLSFLSSPNSYLLFQSMTQYHRSIEGNQDLSLRTKAMSNFLWKTRRLQREWVTETCGTRLRGSISRNHIMYNSWNEREKNDDLNHVMWTTPKESKKSSRSLVFSLDLPADLPADSPADVSLFSSLQ